MRAAFIRRTDNICAAFRAAFILGRRLVYQIRYFN